MGDGELFPSVQEGGYKMHFQRYDTYFQVGKLNRNFQGRRIYFTKERDTQLNT
jgi:hypothetical protein